MFFGSQTPNHTSTVVHRQNVTLVDSWASRDACMLLRQHFLWSLWRIPLHTGSPVPAYKLGSKNGQYFSKKIAAFLVLEKLAKSKVLLQSINDFFLWTILSEFLTERATKFLCNDINASIHITLSSIWYGQVSA